MGGMTQMMDGLPNLGIHKLRVRMGDTGLKDSILGDPIQRWYLIHLASGTTQAASHQK